MRTEFIDRLTELAESDPRIMLVTGDLGFGVLDAFSRKLPRQFLNVGVAEQNMTAVATGLALEGYITFTYSIGNFPTLRCLEQIRNDACYHEANVKIVSVGGGFSYGQLGMSHHATEDLSIMRALPGTTLFAPGSGFEAVAVADAAVAVPGPAYIRLERGSPDFVDDSAVPFRTGQARLLRRGRALALIASGGILAEVVLAAEDLASSGIDAAVLSVNCLKPLDEQSIVDVVRGARCVMTIEENTVVGGLGAAVAECCLEAGVVPKAFRRLGIRDRYTSVVGDQQYLRAAVGIDRAGIVSAAREMIARHGC